MTAEDFYYEMSELFRITDVQVIKEVGVNKKVHYVICMDPKLKNTNKTSITLHYADGMIYHYRTQWKINWNKPNAQQIIRDKVLDWFRNKQWNKCYSY